MPILSELLRNLPVTVIGADDRIVNDAKPQEQAGSADMAFVIGKNAAAAIAGCRAGALFINQADADGLSKRNDDCTYVICKNAKADFFTAVGRLKPQAKRVVFGQSSRAFIHPNAQIGPRTNIHPGATVSSGVVIGADCDIYPGVYIGPNCRLGNSVRLAANVVLYEEVIVGDRVDIQAGSVIGAHGFGYTTTNGRHERIPHVGRVRLEDDVEIGANSVVDRAVLGETVLGAGTKIDNCVVIAHNCHVGRHNLLVSQVGFAGSVTTGDYVVCAGQVGIADHVTIGSGVMIGAQAGVHGNLPKPGSYVGSPAAPSEETLRAVIALQKLPKLRQTVRQLERQMKLLDAQLQTLTNSDQPDDETDRSAA